MASSLAPPAAADPGADPRASAELLDSQAPTLTPPTAHSSPRHEHATLPPEPAESGPAAAESAPPTSEPAPQPEPATAPNPTDIAVTFLLITGTRQTMHFPPSMTFGRAKEAFWGAWTPENAADKPPASSFLRVLHMGKILSDDQTLAAAKLPSVSTNPSGTIVHISIRPFGPTADEDIVKAKRRSRFLSTTNSSSVRPASGSTPNDQEVTHAAGCCSCVIS
ncbi:ubiquitin-like Rad60 SUMO-like protein [Ceratobasidium sp. AG-Ba]|nr:ubiquitin-like Rad60 SUMO-like protein [Ceratobasidium sp. AG-Ba]QRW10912.1 ubiquitin-like Rad60 SUMO-like protein [Ceratobasidium sp. AG-Ba]